VVVVASLLLLVPWRARRRHLVNMARVGLEVGRGTVNQLSEENRGEVGDGRKALTHRNTL
jgi:hypothetical protein